MKIKKLLISLVLLSFVYPLFSLSFEIEAGLPQSMELGAIYNKDTNKTGYEKLGLLTGTMVGLDMMFNQYMGFGCDLSFNIGYLYGTTIRGKGFSETLKKEVTYDRGIGTFLTSSITLDTSLFTGFNIRALESDKFILDIMPGFQFDFYHSSDTSVFIGKESSFNFVSIEMGCGYDITCKWMLKEKFSLNFGFLNSYNFFQVIDGYGVRFINEGKDRDMVTLKTSVNNIFSVKACPRISCTWYL